jgi:hypothetical protein
MTMKLSPPLALFVFGVCAFLLLFFAPSATTPLALAGGLSWAGAYFWVIADNYRRKATVHTRGGLLKYEENPRKYLIPFVLMVIFGAGFLVTFLGLVLTKR